MMLVEVRPIIREVARRHKVSAAAIRAGDQPQARQEVMAELRRQGVTLRELAAMFAMSHTAVAEATAGSNINRGTSGAKAASRCSRCGKLKPLADFSGNLRTVDGCQSYCRPCGSQVDRMSRAATVRYRNRKERLSGDLVHVGVKVPSSVRDLLNDTARRHQVTAASIIEKALAQMLACKDCRRFLRQIGSDYCLACDRQWEAA